MVTRSVPGATSGGGPLWRDGAPPADPPVRPGTVRRGRVLALLSASGAVPLISVAAPAGYGKSTALAQWTHEDGRPVAWLTLERRDDDPVVLVRRVLAGLRRAGLPAAAADESLGRVADPWPAHADELRGVLRRVGQPLILVLDDVDALESQDALGALGALVDDVPDGSSVVLSGRGEMTGIVAGPRAAGRVRDIAAEHLVLDEGETAQLLSAVGAAPLGDDELRSLTRRTEGWAAGIYLMALAAREGERAVAWDSPEVERYVEDYLLTQLLATSPDDLRAFLLESSVLERMSGELCDAVLGRSGSQALLEGLERSNLFLVQLDHERRWYRYHDLFRAALRRRLDRADPGAAARLSARAADWCEASHLDEEALAYARVAGDETRLARLFVTLAFPLYRTGRMATIEGWLAELEDRRTVERFPEIGVLGVFVHAFRGRAYVAERWLDAVHRSPRLDAPLADGSASARPWAAVGEALMCRHGPGRMREDASFAIEGLGPFSPFRAPAMLLLGYALRLEGADEAGLRFEEAAEAAEETGATFAGAGAYAQRALMALARGDLAAAERLATGARRLLAHAEFDDYMLMALCLVADARVRLARGDRDAAARMLGSAQRLRPYLTYAIPYYAVEVLVEMARAHLALGDPRAAGVALVDAADVLRHRPGLGVLGEELSAVRARVADAELSSSGRQATLTAAELRLLPLLTTHLTFQEIADRLYVSRNTVKTQALSLYRKLGASSRSEAVTRASEVGVIGPHPPGRDPFTPSG
jgi:LuxR family maltose regulon positive regulatory protein